MMSMFCAQDISESNSIICLLGSLHLSGGWLCANLRTDTKTYTCSTYIELCHENESNVLNLTFTIISTYMNEQGRLLWPSYVSLSTDLNDS